MKNRKFKYILNTLNKLPVDKQFLEDNKNNLVETIYNDPLINRKSESTKVIDFSIFKLKALPIALILLLIFGSGTALAAKDSLPSDLLYPVKIFSEKIEMLSTIKQDKKIAIALKHADKRITELEQLKTIKSKALEEERIISNILNNYESNIDYANKQIIKRGQQDEQSTTIRDRISNSNKMIAQVISSEQLMNIKDISNNLQGLVQTKNNRNSIEDNKDEDNLKPYNDSSILDNTINEQEYSDRNTINNQIKYDGYATWDDSKWLFLIKDKVYILENFSADKNIKTHLILTGYLDNNTIPYPTINVYSFQVIK